MSGVQIEQKSYEMPPRDGFTMLRALYRVERTLYAHCWTKVSIDTKV